MTTYTSVFSNSLQPSVYNNLTALTFGANITLNWSTQFVNTGNVVSTIMHMNPTAGGLTVTMPDATQTSVGAQFTLNNVSGNAFNLLANDASLIAAIPGPSASVIYLLDNTTVAGTWILIPSGGGFSAVTSINAAAANAITTANLTITGVPGLPITTAGTIEFAFAGDLLSLINFGTNTGFAVRTAGFPPGPISWALRQLTGTPNQVSIVANPDGVAGNPQIGLAANITGITSIQVGNLQIAGNTLSAFAGGDINLVPQGAGKVNITAPAQLWMSNSAPIRFYNAAQTHYLSLAGGDITADLALLLPDTLPMAGQVLSYSGGVQLDWLTVAGFSGVSIPGQLPVFINAGGGLDNSGVSVDGAQNMTGVNSLIASNIRIAVSTPNTITTTVNALTLSAGSGNVVVSGTGLEVRSGQALFLDNAGNTGSGGFSASTTGAVNNVWFLPPTDGINKSFIQTNGAFQLSFTTLTTDYLGKGFGVFDGTSAVGVIPPNTALNITSITKTATGTYTIVVTTGFTAQGYVLSGTVNGNGYIGSFQPTSNTTSSFITYNNAGAATDFSRVCFQLTGLQ